MSPLSLSGSTLSKRGADQIRSRRWTINWISGCEHNLPPHLELTGKCICPTKHLYSPYVICLQAQILNMNCKTLSEGPRVDNETPAYLIDTKKKLERVAYSLRFHFKASHQVKTKLVLSSGKLRIKVKDKDNATWINLDDARASSYLGSEVKFKPEEVPKGGVPSVGDFYKRVLEALD